MTKDELLKYAKENYPIGTKYKCPINIGDHRLGLGINIVELGDEIKFRRSDEIDIIGKGYIYYKGEWAEILEKPKVETKFEVGKWYKNLGVNGKYIAKFKEIKKNTLWVCESYIRDNSFHQVSGELTESFSNAIECPLEEIQQYLPDGHPDKFIPKEKLYKYDNEGNLMESKKYPEYVECISPGKGYTTHPNAKEYGCINYDYNTSLTKGRVYKVLKYIQINSGEWGFVLEFDGKHYLLGEAGAIKSTKEAYEAQFKKDEKFKNGDWLVYIGDCGSKPSTPIKIGDVRQMIGGRFGSLSIYGAKDLSQYFRKALPHEIPINNSIKEKPKLVFPYKVGDKIRCIKLNTWTSSTYCRCPLDTCENKIVGITKVGDFDEECECIPFAATYNGVEYGFSYSDDNKYELVESFEDFVRAGYVEFLQQLYSLPVNPEECYLNKQEVKNPLDDSEREVNINFSKPKQIKF